ncbi:hypothetical protein yc1106_06251 [Curvularia clavata]|uniref:Uncharacterized protein n=1 Tax=Curvularia clavata TaxID=95742 RepID=A0A9Q8ZBC7_CURCL|nr:hypothetical protein yc1106_06251 [Curvularia clavata]
MRLTLLALLPSALALAIPEKRASPPFHPPPHAIFSHSAITKTITVTTTTTITVPGIFPTGNTTFPNATAPVETTSTDLAPITLITLPSETEAVTGETSGLAPITLITLPSETEVVATGTATATVDQGAAPTPNDIAPITLIDVSTATPI